MKQIVRTLSWVAVVALFMGGRLEDAAGIAEAVLEHQPGNLEALLVLAAAQKELGLERRAEGKGRYLKVELQVARRQALADKTKTLQPGQKIFAWVDAARVPAPTSRPWELCPPRLGFL